MRRLISACAVWVIALGSLGTVGGVAFAKGAPLTKGEYVAQYNALCEASIGKTHAALEALGPHHNLDQLVHTIVPIYQHRLDKTRKLVPPTADRKKVKELVAAQQAAIDKVKDDAEVLSGGHIGQGPADTFRRSVGKQADKLAKSYGLESGICFDTPNPGGNGGGPPGTSPCPSVGPCAGRGGGPPPTAPCPGVGPCAGQGGPSVPPTAVVGGGTVPAAQWVTAVCAAEATLHGTLQGELDAVKSKSDATAQRQGFVDFFSGLPAQVKTLESAVKKAGAPNATNGKKIAKTYVKTLEAIVKKAPSLKSMAETLPTSSKDALQTAGKSIGNAIDAIKRKGDDKVSMLDSSGMLSPDLGRCGGIFPL